MFIIPTANNLLLPPSFGAKAQETFEAMAAMFAQAASEIMVKRELIKIGFQFG